ncbi:MAG: head-tail connector protein [Proteobacteria bacterium]|nr:head-tail connector protein [Pseudomonadota bacterium]
MSLTLISPPEAEPLPLADLKAFLKVDGAGEDALIGSIATAARAHLEALTAKAFVTQGWRIRRDAWAAHGRMTFPIGPVASLDAVTVTRVAGEVSLPLDLFRLDGDGLPPRLSWTPSAVPMPAVPMAGIAIDVTAGYGGPGDVPAPLVQAVRLLAAHWYENRTLVTVGHEVAVMPRTVEALIAPFLVRRVA